MRTHYRLRGQTLCVGVGSYFQSHSWRVEWVGVAHWFRSTAFTGTIAPGFDYWYFWADFGSNQQVGTWAARYYFDNTYFTAKCSSHEAEPLRIVARRSWTW